MIDILPNWHPIFVHFTVALLSVSLLVFILSFLSSNEVFKEHAQVVARWNFWLGVIASVATAIAGWYAYNSVAHDTPSHAAMTIHKNWALITLIILLIVASAAWWLNHHIRAFGIGLVVVFVFLSITAWHGGELVYRYGLGVMSIPMAEGEGHDHAGHEHGHTDKDMEAHHDNINTQANSVDSDKEANDSAIHIHSDGEVHNH